MPSVGEMLVNAMLRHFLFPGTLNMGPRAV